MPDAYLTGTDGHYLKNRSSLLIVILSSLRKGQCVACGKRYNSLEEYGDHWMDKLGIEKREAG